MNQMQCVGWWEQSGLGRQSMSNLQLTFSDGTIFGGGTDMVGDFEMKGELRDDEIYLHKQYIGQHAIEYHGVSIGEGAYSGIWICHGIPGGKWFIAFVRSSESGTASIDKVQEIGGS
jgi:hypothetical protein